MTQRVKEMMMSEDIEMVNLGLTLAQEEQPDIDELVSTVKNLLHHDFYVRSYADIFSGEQRLVIGRNWKEQTYLFVKDPTKLLKLVNK